MDALQNIIVYLIVALAVWYLANKYILPKFANSKKKKNHGCGDGDCGCNK